MNWRPVKSALMDAREIPKISSLISVVLPVISEIIKTPKNAPIEQITSHLVTFSLSINPASKMTTIGLRLKMRLHLLTSICVKAYEKVTMPMIPTITQITSET